MATLQKRINWHEVLSGYNSLVSIGVVLLTSASANAADACLEAIKGTRNGIDDFN
jgi:hypothetical protein